MPGNFEGRTGFSPTDGESAHSLCILDVKTKGIALAASKVFDQASSPSIGCGQCMYLVDTRTKSLLGKIHTSDGLSRLTVRGGLKTRVALLGCSSFIFSKVHVDALAFTCTFSGQKHVSWVSMETRDDKNATTTLGKTKTSQTNDPVSPAVPQVLEFFDNVRDSGLLGFIFREMPHQKTRNVLQ